MGLPCRSSGDGHAERKDGERSAPKVHERAHLRVPRPEHCQRRKKERRERATPIMFARDCDGNGAMSSRVRDERGEKNPG